MAKGLAKQGKRAAFGDGTKIKWDHNSELIFRNNPNIAPPEVSKATDLVWIDYYKGHRKYNWKEFKGGPWKWNMDFRPVPGEFFFTSREKRIGAANGTNFIIIEPNVDIKDVAPNKDWGFAKYQQVVARLLSEFPGIRIMQFQHAKSGPMLRGVKPLHTIDFRHAALLMSNARLYIGPEGGLHHTAAAVGVKGVVIFGGFIPPSTTGYDMHENLIGNATHFCGSVTPCAHCRSAMESISIDEVYRAAKRQLKSK